MSKIFFTSDLHFSHKNIAKFCPHTRPQGTIDVLDEYMIELWNDTVGVNDVVYNLGDLSFSYDLCRIKTVLERLNGQHHLIFGNHDDVIATHLDKLLTAKKLDGHPMLSSAQAYLKLKIADKTLILFHYPINEWDGCHKGYYHLHGHIHDRMADVAGRILNVGFDLHGKFLTLDDVAGYLGDLPKLNHHGDDSLLGGLDVPKALETGSYVQVCQDDEWGRFLVDSHSLIEQKFTAVNSQEIYPRTV
ncbi:phosphoesterase [Moraxella nasovis]|uniref:phosphoesterase n=1 Tax=Moraxella nasovis TaxID=2904121 RepID=UPI001F61899D|nr:phosphoesterase [Moraxella nasovis]UNU73777.1 phosphoesterase [Moraxella nasovis]